MPGRSPAAVGLISGWRFFWVIAIWLWCSAGTAAVAPLVLDAAGGHPLGGHITVLRDAPGNLDIAAVRQAQAEGRFQLPRSTTPGLGYGPGAWWVYAVLINPGSGPETRWLEHSFPMQHSSVLYLVRADGQIQQMENGIRVPIEARPLPMRQILFPLELAAEESVAIYLRLSGLSLANANFTLWKPAAYVDASRRYLALKYLLMGASLIVVVFALLAWEARKRPGLLYGAAAGVLTVFLLFILDGLAMDWRPIGEELWPYRLRNLVALLTLACDAAFTVAFLDLYRHAPRLARAVNRLALLCVVLALAFTLYIDHPALFHGLLLAILAALLGVGIFAAWRRLPFGRLYLLAWGFVWVGVMLRSLIEFGLFPDLPLLPDLNLMGFAACSLTISIALYLDIRQVRASAETTHQHYLRFQVNEKERLAAAVEARTRELREAKALAEEISQAKTTFLSEVSHELRAPLHTILGYTHLLERDADGETAAKLGIISQSGDRLVRLIDDVLAFSRSELKDFEPLQEPMSLAALVAQVEQSARLQAAQRGNRFDIYLAPGLPTSVLADEHALLQILQNLISNACKFTQLGEIRLSIEPEPDQTVSDSDQIQLRFTVADTGIGIAQEDQERIFAPFCRIRHARRQPGIGLGLAIARRLARAMGGDIRVNSAPGQGSRFRFSLPFKATRLDAPASHDPAVQLICGHKGRQRIILIVDDQVDNRGFMQQLCSHWGFATVVAGDGNEALAACYQANPPIDLALVDQYMPDADGWSFLRGIRARPELARMPVILVSAAPAARPVGFPEGMEFDGVLMKPLQTSVLVQLLARRLGLEWIRRDQPSAPPPVLDLRCVNLSRIEVEQLHDALKLGKVLNLQRHAAALARTNPECAPFAQEVVRLCTLIDLPGLQRLFDQALPQPTDRTGRDETS